VRVLIGHGGLLNLADLTARTGPVGQAVDVACP
jgi:hypothetical protein